MSEEVKLDWSSAEVHDRTLTIALDGKLEKGWKRSFKTTTRLLNRGTWEEVTLKKGTVLVRPVASGDEDRVRQFLEGVVLQANSDVDHPDEGDEDRTGNADDVKEKDAGQTAEEHDMTERYRSFAEVETDRAGADESSPAP